MKIEIEFNAEPSVKIPTINGKYLMFKKGKFVSMVYAGGEDGKNFRIYEDGECESINHPWYKDCVFYRIDPKNNNFFIQ